MHLQPAHARPERVAGALGQHLDLGPLLERRAAQRAGDHGAEAAHREDAVDREPAGAVAQRARGGGRRRLLQGRSERVEPRPGVGGDRHDRRACQARSGELLLDVQPGELERLLVDGVHLGERHHAALDPEQVADREVLAGLRHHALVRGHHEQHQVDPGGAGDHGAHQALVARHVHDAEPAARRQVERREAELDRDAAALLLGEPVGVDAGQRPDQRGLAVIDVPRGAQDQAVAHPIRSNPVYF